MRYRLHKSFNVLSNTLSHFTRFPVVRLPTARDPHYTYQTRSIATPGHTVESTVSNSRYSLSYSLPKSSLLLFLSSLSLYTNVLNFLSTSPIALKLLPGLHLYPPQVPIQGFLSIPSGWYIRSERVSHLPVFSSLAILYTGTHNSGSF